MDELNKSLELVENENLGDALAEYAAIVKGVAEEYPEGITVVKVREDHPELKFLEDDEIEEIIMQVKKRNTRNEGFCNSGHCNSGHCNSGNRNSSDYNSGDCNSGHYNSGNYNSGHYNSGHYNSGNCNSGHCNSGDYNSGNCNSGHCNSGNCNSGNCNSGNCNSGNYNSGDYNKASQTMGCFNTQRQKLRFFDEETDMTLEEWRSSEAYRLMNRIDFRPTDWIFPKDMTKEEKAAHPEYETTNGYLKIRDNAYCYTEWWSRLSDEEKNIIRRIPNYDAEKFFLITGIRDENM